MKAILIESLKNEEIAYKSTIVDPKNLGIFSNQLTLDIIGEMAKTPACAMDIARRLKQNEQKIYYHLRKLERGGIIKLIGTEERYGMTAKIYSTVSPVIAAKLYEDGQKVTNKSKIEVNDMSKLLHPFIEGGKLNCDIVFGSPYPHGEYEAMARDTVHFTDFALFLGRFINSLNTYNYKLDVQMRDNDLKNNLILIGGPRINTIVNKLNDDLPIYFDKNDNWTIKSKLTNKSYHDDENGIIVRIQNPYAKDKEILIMAGRRSVGLRSTILAFLNHSDEIMKGNVKDSRIIAKVVSGFDKSGDGRIDTVNILE